MIKIFPSGLLLSVALSMTACAQPAIEVSSVESELTSTPVTQELVDPDGKTVAARFRCPNEAERIDMGEGTFASYLRILPLRPVGSEVKYYDGQVKRRSDVYAAVVDMDLDAQDLQQCADAVMRLRGEYLFSAGRKDEIHFDFISDGKPRYFSEYANGDSSYARFRKYMKYIFSYANTASLKNELERRPIDHMQIGDVFIQQGNPYGHAVIVVDMCENASNGEKYFMLAQSYMPAQDTQVLLNPKSSEGSVWYRCCDETIHTPEWTFSSADLRHF